MSRLLIAGTGSGCGKTTATLALLSALKAEGHHPTAFKCGPDYIDPMFHRAVSGVSAYNLDPFFLDGLGLRVHLSRNSGPLNILEGAMGYYDGIAATDEASAYTVARETETPAVLVVSAKGAGHSLAAVLEGFAHHRADSGIRGVIFNDAGDMRYPDLQTIAAQAGIRAYGYLPRVPEWSVPGRHLGLMTAGEIFGLREKIGAMGEQAARSLDISGLLDLAATAPKLPPAPPLPGIGRTVRLAVARDAAFCFLYQENLDLLESLGCELVFFSPLADAALPENIHGLYLCGGYPELHAETLEANASMRNSVRCAIQRGLPTIAECGGFLFLHDTLDGRAMCGAVRGAAFETARLQRFGYITLTAKKDNLLCAKGQSIRSHEFHYWDSESPGADFIAAKAGRDRTYPCVHATETLYAGFPHLYLPANVRFAENFVSAMERSKQ